VNGEGGTLGPNLSVLGTAQPVDFIIGAIMEPQKEVKEGFMSVSVVTKDGEDFQGYIISESSKSIVLRTPAEQIEIGRDNIERMKQSGSLMPSGLIDGLSREEFCDLVKYLSELGKLK
jgi:putative heme-binding domain-containing protein